MKKMKIGSKELAIESVYPFRYDYGNGKEVLRIEVLETNHSFDEVKVLSNTENQTIEYYEDDVKKIEYVGYYKDFSCQYADGKYSVEITRVSESDLKIAELEKKIAENTEVINTMLLTNLEGDVANV